MYLTLLIPPAQADCLHQYVLMPDESFQAREVRKEVADQRTPDLKMPVLLKTHFCDAASGGYCLDTTRIFASPILSFVQKYFVLYHARLARPREDGKGMVVADLIKGSPQIAKEWHFSSQRPQATFLDLKTCKIIDEYKLNDLAIADAYRNRTEETLPFFLSVRNDVLRTDVVRKAVGDPLDEPARNRLAQSEWEAAQQALRTRRFATRKETHKALFAQKNFGTADVLFNLRIWPVHAELSLSTDAIKRGAPGARREFPDRQPLRAERRL